MHSGVKLDNILQKTHGTAGSLRAVSCFAHCTSSCSRRIDTFAAKILAVRIAMPCSSGTVRRSTVAGVFASPGPTREWLASLVSPAQRGALAADGVARVPHRERSSHSRYRVTLEQPCSAQWLTKVGTVETV
jgi:hypothetical protein